MQLATFPAVVRLWSPSYNGRPRNSKSVVYNGPPTVLFHAMFYQGKGIWDPTGEVCKLDLSDDKDASCEEKNGHE